MIYREMNEIELHLALFEEFQRTQVVEQCWRKVAGTWKLQTVPFLDDWNQNEQEELIAQMKRIKAQHGFVYGAFQGDRWKGFVAVEGERMGSLSQYLDILYLYVSQELRNQGMDGYCYMKRLLLPKGKVYPTFIFLLILPWKPKRFIEQWGVWKHMKFKHFMLHKRHLIASWNMK